MQKKIILLFVSLCLVVVGYAQPKITHGNSYEVFNSKDKDYIAKGIHLLAIKAKSNYFYLSMLNTGNLTFEKSNIIEDFTADFRMEMILEIQDKIYVSYSVWDGTTTKLFVREVDFEACAFKGTERSVVSVDDKARFHFFFSGDSSKIAVRYRFKPESRRNSKNYDNIGLHVFDSDFNQLWYSRLKMPYTEEKMSVLNYALDAKANAYIVAKVNDEPTTYQQGIGVIEPGHLEILRIASGTAAITQTTIDLKGNFAKSLLMLEDAKGYMNIGGFYNKGKKLTNADGVFTFKLREDNEVVEINMHEIPLEVLNQFVKERTKLENSEKDKTDEAELEHLLIKKLVIQDDGSVIVVGEQQFTTIQGSSSQQQLEHYDNILVAKIDAAGNLAWMKKIPKRQEAKRPTEELSFQYFGTGGKHYLMFLDHKENIDLPVDDVPYIHSEGRGGIITSYVIDDQFGGVTKFPVLNTLDVQGGELVGFTPPVIKKIAEGVFAFEAHIGGKGMFLIKLEF